MTGHLFTHRVGLSFLRIREGGPAMSRVIKRLCELRNGTEILTVIDHLQQRKVICTNDAETAAVFAAAESDGWPAAERALDLMERTP